MYDIRYNSYAYSHITHKSHRKVETKLYCKMRIEKDERENNLFAVLFCLTWPWHVAYDNVGFERS